MGFSRQRGTVDAILSPTLALQVNLVVGILPKLGIWN